MRKAIGGLLLFAYIVASVVVHDVAGIIAGIAFSIGLAIFLSIPFLHIVFGPSPSNKRRVM